jgi:ribose 5-phosphate isomerase B
MRLHIGSDHAGLELKNELLAHLVNNGHDVTDHGPYEYDALDDYPDPTSLGVVIGGSGNGEQISANKVKGIRAVLAWSIETAKLGKEHNNANVVSIGGRMHTIDQCKEIIDAFIATPFSNDERHIRRINKMSKFEETGEI